MVVTMIASQQFGVSLRTYSATNSGRHAKLVGLIVLITQVHTCCCISTKADSCAASSVALSSELRPCGRPSTARSTKQPVYVRVHVYAAVWMCVCVKPVYACPIKM